MQTSEKQTAVGKQSEKAGRKSRRKKGMCQQERPLVESHAAGIDVGAREMYVAIPADRDRRPVRVFATFTADLAALVDWLVDRGITTVAMESTGVYWVQLCQMLVDRGVRVCLVNARHMKNVPGRRTDWHECQWLQYLHSVGLLRGAFRPERDICAVRTVMRHRSELVKMASQHVLHMQKAMTQMNIQLHHVISDITGVTGLAIVDAILGGERSAVELAKLRREGIRADQETIRKSLEGDWRAEHLFTLRQSREMYGIYWKQIEACDREIVQQLTGFEARVDANEKPLPPDSKGRGAKRKSKRAGDFRFEVRPEAYQLFGVDVTQIPGVGGIALGLFSEVGRDLTRFATAGHFASWLGLCPDNDKSGGRVLWTGIRKIQNRAAGMFRMAAHSLHRSATPLGGFSRRMKAKLGPQAGISATAHKIAIIFYTLVKNQVEYDESIWELRDTRRQQRYEQMVKRQAKALGFDLVPTAPA